MGQFSRVNKNKDMYQNIIEEKDTQTVDSSLRDFERRTSKVRTEENTYSGNRFKAKDDYINITPTSQDDHELINQEAAIDLSTQSTSLSDSNETKQYSREMLEDVDLLSDFIEEVKHYNIDKGLRSFQDTQSNILSNLQKSNELETPEAVVELTTEIQKIIEDLENQNEILEEKEVDQEVMIDLFKPLDDKDDQVISEMLNEIETSALDVINPINALLNEKEDDKLEEHVSDLALTTSDQGSYETNELLELTQSLSLKLDIQENELKQVKDHNSLLDKTLTVIIVLLVVALVVLALFGLWWVNKERGL